MVDLINEIRKMNEIKSENAARKISIEKIFCQGYNEACGDIIKMLYRAQELKEKDVSEDVF